MIKTDFFSEKSIRAKRDEFKIADPGLFEKAIYAFELLGCLSELGLNFVFKGGTSLLLHIPEPQRLSIDIDILCSEQPEKLISTLEKISTNSSFIKFEENERGHRGLPHRRHFKFFFDSKISKRDDYVLLDVVEERNCKLPIEDKIIQTIFFETNEDIKVKIPTVEGLLGDKLTAFAPNTTGVPFLTKNGNDHSLQVVKQLFDIGQLFNISSDYDIITEAYNSSFNQENIYKKGIYSREQALDDTAETALELCRVNIRGHKPSATSKNLVNGISKIKSHLINNLFRQNIEAKVAASKAYMLSIMINAGSFDLLRKYEKYTQSASQIELIKNSSIDIQLDRLKGPNPEAYYYLAIGHNVNFH